MHDILPPSTLRDLGRVIAALATIIFEKAARLFAKLRPFAEPPDDLRVTSTRGASYSGGIVIDENEIIGGVVIKVGQKTPGSRPDIDVRSPVAAAQRPIIPRDPYERDRGEDRTFLKGWATDPREEEEPWRSR